MDAAAFYQVGVLTLAGMAVIFIFMGLLIIVSHFFIAVATRFFPDREGDDGASPGAVSSADEETAAAIAAALFRKGGK